ncbi:YrhA family protein [Hymenobacter terrenus]|uniref:YrhA family protein n=1 Tax=Hymenobacter terrenus TaxID=1629124 RepID=UPI001E4C48C6|nr:YrhA family protein [Hymenobacter terrenus]
MADAQWIAPAALPQELEALHHACTQQLNYHLPSAYLDLLRLANGIDANGIQLYASQAQTRVTPEGRTKYLFRGIVEANEQWRDFPPNKEFVFFAESGDVLYCHNLTSGKFEIVDRITNELIYQPSSFDTCEKLLEKLLNHMLNCYE